MERLNVDKADMESRNQALHKEKGDQDELIKLVKENLQDMRGERESLSNEVTSLKAEMEQLNQKYEGKVEELAEKSAELDKLKEIVRKQDEKCGSLESQCKR